eukprot:932771-Prorocentrum_minimum.AAC.1
MLIIVVPPHPKRSFESTLYIHLLDAYNESIDPRKYARRKYAYRKYQVCFWFRFSQPHLKKCFEGIKKLEMHKPGTDGRRHYEATGMFSPDGEYIPFAGTCVTDGRPEDWLNKVKEFPGQCIISAGQMVWTSECERSLADADTAKSALRQLKKKWISYLNKLTGLTRSRLDKIVRKKARIQLIQLTPINSPGAPMNSPAAPMNSPAAPMNSPDTGAHFSSGRWWR